MATEAVVRGKLRHDIVEKALKAGEDSCLAGTGAAAARDVPGAMVALTERAG